jgi:hypothetical protein
MRSSRLCPRLLLLPALLLALAGCWNPFRPEVSTDRVVQSTGAAPQPTSSRNVMKLFKWCWDNQNITEYEKIFTDDFRFAFAEADSQGNAFPGHALIREEEIDIARHLFVGGRLGEPPANSIALEYRSPLIPDPDTRPGKTEPYHVMFQTDVDITIRADQGTFHIQSKAVFFAVVWDSANKENVVHTLHIPENKRRWFIERYEELGPSTVIYRPPDEQAARRLTTWERLLRATSGPAANTDFTPANGRPGSGAAPARSAEGARPEPSAPATATDSGPFDREVTWGWAKSHWY